MDFDTLFAPVVTGVTTAVTDTTPLGVGVMIIFASVTAAIAILRKFGVRR